MGERGPVMTGTARLAPFRQQGEEPTSPNSMKGVVAGSLYGATRRSWPRPRRRAAQERLSGISLVAGGISTLRDSTLAGDEIPIESQRNWLQQANVCNAGGEPLDVAEVAPVIADDDLVDGAHLIARLLFISSSGREALHKTDLSTGASNAGF
jgi:hypothetical protein